MDGSRAHGSGPSRFSALPWRGVAPVAGEDRFSDPAYAYGVAPAPGGRSPKVRLSVAYLCPLSPRGLRLGFWHAVVLASERTLLFSLRGLDGSGEGLPGSFALVDDRVSARWSSALLPVSRSALLGSRNGGRVFVAHGMASLGSFRDLSSGPFPVGGSRSWDPW